jgi:HEPN domain-containing protein
MVDQWLIDAETDLRGAKALFDAGEQFFYMVTFHCQQSAEKAIKCYMTYNKIAFPKTHSSKDLIKIVQKFDNAVATKLLGAVTLDAYAVAFRYPDSRREDLSVREVSEAIQTATKILEICKKQIHI